MGDLLAQLAIAAMLYGVAFIAGPVASVGFAMLATMILIVAVREAKQR